MQFINARAYFKRTKFAAMFCMKLLNNLQYQKTFYYNSYILQIKVVPMQQVNISKKVRAVMIEFCYFSFTSIFLGFSFSSASFFCLLTSTSCKEIHERNPAFYQFLTFFLLWKSELHNSAKFFHFRNCLSNRWFLVVMGRTPFYRTSKELEHHISNIVQTWTCSSIGDNTQTPYFWHWTNDHRT